MASIHPKDPSPDTHRLVISHKALLGEPRELRFRSDATGRSYDKAVEAKIRIEADLAENRIPIEFQAPAVSVRAQRVNGAHENPPFFKMLGAFETRPHAKVTDSQKEIGGYLMKEIRDVRFLEMTMEWVHTRLDYYKIEKKYEPGTIKKRIEFLSNVANYTQQQISKEKKFTICEQLPTNYAKRDDYVSPRERRSKIGVRPLTKEREAAISAVFTGEKEIPTKSIPSLRDPKLETLFTLISNTGLRLSEAYMVKVEDLDFKEYVLHVGGTKGRDDEIKHRQTTMRKAVRESLAAYIQALDLQPDDFLFRDGWWTGDCDSDDRNERKKARKATSSYLSGTFRALYAAAGVTGITEHDLRHEATIRYIEMKDDKGQPIYDREDLMKMMGWATYAMADLYLSTWRPNIGRGRISDDA